MELSEQEIIRRQKLEELQKLGIDPYPAALWEISANSRQLIDTFESNPDAQVNISFAGRITCEKIPM